MFEQSSHDYQDNRAFRKKRFHRGKIVSSFVEDAEEEVMAHSDHIDLTKRKSTSAVVIESTHNTRWMRFTNASQQLEYIKFRRRGFSSMFYLVIISFLFISLGYLLSAAISYERGDMYSIVCILFLVFLSLASFIILSARGWESSEYNFIPIFYRKLMSICDITEGFLIVTNSTLWGLLLVAQCLSQSCSGFGSHSNVLSCIYESNSHLNRHIDTDDEYTNPFLPVDLVVILILSTHLLQISLPGNHQHAVLIAWIISVFCIIFSFLLIKAYNTPLVILFTIGYGVVLFHHEKQLLDSFLQHLDDVKADLLSATLLTVKDSKNIISNITNDMMLHIQTLNQGLEAIQTNLDELKDFIHEQTNLIHKDISIHLLMQCAVQQETLANMNVTNSFISMTLNKSHDFIIASEGLPLVPALHSIDLHKTIHWPIECVRGIQSLIPIDFDPIPSDVCPFIVTDKTWLEENIGCLVTNAAKYSGCGRISVRVALVSKMIRVEVEDTGEGVPNPMKASIFAVSKQTQKQTGGTGLGLFCFAKRLEALGGLYGVTDRAAGQKGAIFWFEFPYMPDWKSASARDSNLQANSKRIDNGSFDLFDEKEQEERGTEYNLHSAGYSLQAKIKAQFSSGSNNGSKSNPNYNDNSNNNSNKPNLLPTIEAALHTELLKRKEGQNNKVKLQNMLVLVVDDSPPIYKMTAKVLEANGHRVAYAENGAIALNLMKAYVYDVVLMDLQMPVMDGFESVRRLRQYEQSLGWEEGRHQLIAGVSASSDEKTKEAALLAGMDFFIPKPFTMGRFIQIMETLDLTI